MKNKKFNLICNDDLGSWRSDTSRYDISKIPSDFCPSTSAFNGTKYIEWVSDGSGEANFYMNARCLDVLHDVSSLPKYVWLLESRNIIPQIFDFIEQNKEFMKTRCDGIFTCDKELAKNDGFFYAITNAATWVQELKVYEKTKLVSMISSNKGYTPGHRFRLKYVEKFRDKVDLYGEGFRWIGRKEEALKDYMFSINIENACYDTYFTEKLTDCFATGTIPIFYGCKSVVEYFNEDGIIFLDDEFDIDELSEELYHSKMDAILDNFERIQKFPVAEDFIYKNYFQ